MKYYQLVHRKKGKRIVSAPEDFETTARNVAALFEEGYTKVELHVTETRLADEREVEAIVAQAKVFLNHAA